MIESKDGEVGEMSAPETQKKPTQGWYEFLRFAAVALALALFVRFYVAQPFIVRGASMEPNFEDREYLVIDEASYHFREPERGEVVVFRYPRNTDEFFIKRIIGLPGEQVVISGGHVKIINAAHPEGFVLGESYLSADVGTYLDQTKTLAAGQYFVLGDNRPASSDSRVWGVLDRGFIVGRVFFRAWPLTRLGIVLDNGQ
ncbi:MAG: signal peptidase I [bacterium]|nr:signal peptidase I [bacterium]MDZ4299386.1 signal peptidase I [Candidatus Sungbacteria bacterium]